MKKILIASTALVAAGMLTAGSAAAAEKIKLQLGGFSKWMVVGAWQNDSAGDLNTVDVKGDNEIFFGGETTLDNGLTIGVAMEMEAGGHSDSNDDTFDKSYMYVSGGFGKVIIGKESNGVALLHVSAPDAVGSIGAEGILTDFGALVAPTGFAYRPGTAADPEGEVEKVTYVAPSFGGLTVGASYIPNGRADVRGPVDLSAADNLVGESFGAGALYANQFGGVGFKLSAGYVNGEVEAGTIGVSRDTTLEEFTVGTQVAFGNITVGGSYRSSQADAAIEAGIDGAAWDLGVQYASGPYAVSLYYFNSQYQSNTVGGDDEMQVYQLSGKYTLGAGVDAIGMVGYGDFDAANDTVADNKGVMVMTGIALAF